MSELIEKSKELFYKMVNDHGSDPYHLLPHVPEVEKWAKFILKNHPEADSEIVILSVWLHDIGHYPILKIDHAITGEKRAKEFLTKEKFDKNKINKVLNCIRAHRCKDVLPETIEAKIIAVSDSASHLTDTIYIDMAKDGKSINSDHGRTDLALEKLERDYRDLSLLPEIKEQLKDIYESWKRLLNDFEKIDF